MDPDSDPHPDPETQICLKSFSAGYFFNVHLHHFSKIKSQKEVTKQ